MIILTKINDEKIVINDANIECIELIPEAKIVMNTGKYYIVKESAEEIIQKTIEYNGRVCTHNSLVRQNSDTRLQQ